LLAVHNQFLVLAAVGTGRFSFTTQCKTDVHASFKMKMEFIWCRQTSYGTDSKFPMAMHPHSTTMLNRSKPDMLCTPKLQV